MTPEEIAKAKEYSRKCEEFHQEKVGWMPEEFVKELEDFVGGLIGKYEWTITADDTHRWVECDGWYEVEFELNTEIGDIYINTESGDQDLEDEWSENNPQEVSLDDCYLYGRSWDWYYFLENLYETYERHQNKSEEI
jgi:hypothetical protein